MQWKEDITLTKEVNQRPMRVLTVGDGDLSLSLSLARAYLHTELNLTATTLCASYQGLCDTYSNSASVVKELVEERYATVFYGIDATHLSECLSACAVIGHIDDKDEHSQQRESFTFDFILFHHPHLGLMTSKSSVDEQYHAERHFVLLAHYFASAKALLTENGRIHLCLAHDQPQTWQMEQAARIQGLELVRTANTEEPFHKIITECVSKDRSTPPQVVNALNPRHPEPGHAAPRRYRNGKLGSRHWLGRYGYRHRRTHGDKFDGGNLDMNVEGSRHFFFGIGSRAADVVENTKSHAKLDAAFQCSICLLSFQSHFALERHLEAPALPDPVVDTAPKTRIASSPVAKRHRQETISSSGNAQNEEEITRLATTDFKNLPQRDDSSFTLEHSQQIWKVTQEQEGKRLRRFLQHIAFQGRSKRECDRLVSNGNISVNGSIAMDTSRILTVGDVVLCTLARDKIASTLHAIDFTTMTTAEKTKLQVVARYPDPLREHNYVTAKDDILPADNNATSNNAAANLFVINKPVGMRLKGDYDLGRSAEQILSWQLSQGKDKCKSLSGMDTGCGGLCVLQVQSPEVKGDAISSLGISVTWDDGISARVPWKSVRRWGRQATKLEVKKSQAYDVDGVDEKVQNIDEIPNDTSAGNDQTVWMMSVKCRERTSSQRRRSDGKVAPALSTLTVKTACSASGVCRAIILYLRKQQYPVVGDRLCQREYQELPRSMRNRIKKKLLLGCFRVNIQVEEIKSFGAATKELKIGESASDSSLATKGTSNWSSAIEIPERFRAKFWQEHFEGGDVFASAANTKKQILS